MKNKPPFQITSLILNQVATISRELEILADAQLRAISVELRRQSVIRTIQSSLAIEGNTLSVEKVSDIFDGKKVLGPIKDIQEVRNAVELYGMINEFDALSILDLKKAHGILMKGLVDQYGMWRTRGVGIFKGEEAIHMAPSAKIVPELMDNLFEFIQKDKETSWLIKACVFHYEFEFIHPFADGNGRMGRLWQQLLLMKEDPIFQAVTVESLIRKNQQQYYDVLAACDKAADSTLFIEFSLECILEALRDFKKDALLREGLQE